MDNIYGKVLTPAGVDFGAVRDGRSATLFYVDVNLTTARSIAAGTALIVEFAGDTFYCDLDPNNEGAAVIHIQDTALSARTAPVYVTPGFIAKVPFTQLLIENVAQTGKRLRLFYGVGVDFQAGAGASVNVSGTVSVQDGSKARTLAGTAFIGGASQPAVAAELPIVQLRNAAGSAVNVVLEKLYVVSQSAQGVISGRYDTAETLSQFWNSKLIGGADSTTTSIRIGSDPANVIVGGSMFDVELTARVGVMYELREPIVIAPNTAFALQGGTVNTDLKVTFEGYEETI